MNADFSFKINTGHTRYILVKPEHLWAYQCQTCGHVVADFPATDAQKQDPMKLMYPDKYVTAVLMQHDATHVRKELPSQKPTIEGHL